MKNKQTAVEWLYHQIVIKNSDVLKFRQYLEQAKQMEKEQIIDAWDVGKDSFSSMSAEQYYNETYEK